MPPAPDPSAPPPGPAILAAAGTGIVPAIEGQGGDIDRVRGTIAGMLPEGAPSLEDVARHLRVAPSAIRREIAAEGSGFRDLVEEVRRERAISLLKERQLPFSEIAFLLGYSEISAFSRAMRRWTGTSPRGWQRQAGH